MNAPESKDTFKVVGTRPIRPDGVEKVTGKAIFGPDYKASNMLFGAIVRSPHPHARVRGIDTKKAEAVAGVHACVTGADFPTLEDTIIRMGESAGSTTDMSQNVMAQGTVFYDGHAVAAVAATSQEAADEAAALIEVDYEVLPHVIDINDAFKQDAPVIHKDQRQTGLGEGEKAGPNVSTKFVMANGEMAKALEGAAATVSEHYSLLPVHQGYIEPHACVATWKADGKIDIWCSSQGAFNIRMLTASFLHLEIGRIRVMPLEIGGGFGGKNSVYIEPVAALLSKKSGRPVRLAMSRSDVFRATGPAPGAEIDVTLGADADGKLVAADVTFKYSAGAFRGTDAMTGVMHAISQYLVPAFSVTGWEVICNMPKHAAYRAPGAPQVNFAVESAMNELADELGLDPLDIRIKNAVAPGMPSMMGTPFGEIGLVECLEAAKVHPHYSAPLGPNQARGVACGTWMNFGGPSTASVSIAEDGSVLVAEGNPDIGGSRASMAMMAAETFGISYDEINVTIADTSSIGFSMMTGGSRTTFATGKAVVEAAQAVIEILCERAAKMLEVDVGDVEWMDGEAVSKSAGKRLTLKEIAVKSGATGGPISFEKGVNPLDHLPGYGVHICDTEVDPETGHVTVTRYTAVQDVGRAIHPAYVEGQLQGGAVQGIGWALNEAYIYNKDGTLDNAGFLDYRMPVASDMPMIDTVMIEKPNPAHPYGVKGVGEVSIVPPLAAVGAAVGNAIGKPMRDLPISPDRVYSAMNGKG
ncbi:MAG: xanthine dehydrogenase family protein molybdopterin-binding subunit [Sphingomonadaceae bacterium]|nr:xanthine dehydrogenase family protein molybdopterin-binding subunit [Sphingomonadaceae bacterium]